MKYLGEVVIAIGIGTVLLFKAALEKWHFHDPVDAKKTLFIFFVSVGSICGGLCFSLLLDYLS